MTDTAPLVMAADDSEIDRDLLVHTLETGGYHRHILAGSGESVLDQLKQGTRPDVILLDIRMDGIDGVETCARIRSLDGLDDVPILMVTGQRDEASLTQAFMAGANDYVTKPYDRVELLARIGSALALKGERERRVAREAALSDARARLAQASSTSGFFHERLPLLSRDGLIAYAHRLLDDHQPFAVVAIQLDALPRFRQRYGDEDVDGMIDRVAEAIGAIDGPLVMQLGLYDDGLFLALLAGGKRQEALRIGDRICRTVNGLEITHHNSPVSSVVTASVGVAAGRSLQILSDAIAATEDAYAEGGNRVSCAHPI